MKIYELPEKKFKLSILKKLSERQENTDNKIKSGKQSMNKMRISIKKQKW